MSGSRLGRNPFGAGKRITDKIESQEALQVEQVLEGELIDLPEDEGTLPDARVFLNDILNRSPRIQAISRFFIKF